MASVYYIHSSPGKGVGLFATCDIPAGFKILSEAPMCSLPADQDQVDAYYTFLELSEHEQEVFVKLTYAVDDERLQAFANQLRKKHMPFERIRPLDYHNGAIVLAIWENNSFLLNKTGEYGSGIFEDASRINHSCQQNAAHTWDEKLGHETVHALRDISKGEEITISYVQPIQATSVRQAQLREIYGFTCDCSACDVFTPAGVESTFRRTQIQALLAYLDDVRGQIHRDLLIKTTIEALRLMTLEKILSWDKGKRYVRQTPKGSPAGC